MVSNSGDFDGAVKVWEEMKEKECYPTLVSYTAYMKILFGNNRVKEATDVFKEMIQSGLSPNCHTYTVLMDYLIWSGKYLMAKHKHIFWTPCAAHCLDLMLEDFGKIDVVKSTINRALFLCGYIYSHTRLLNLTRNFTGQGNLIRPEKTRFATSFLTLSSIQKYKANLRELFTCEEWKSSNWAKDPKGKRAEAIVLNTSLFWKNIVYSIQIAAPLVKVLRLVDNERKPCMGYIYEAMWRAKETIQKSFGGGETKCQAIFEMIDKRRDEQLHKPLHAAGHFLNPSVYYSDKEAIDKNAEVQIGLIDCIEKYSDEVAQLIIKELPIYKEAEAMFGKELAKKQHTTLAPAQWWATYETSTPNLKACAIRILSLTCSASGCERNWSVFELENMKKLLRFSAKCKKLGYNLIKLHVIF